MPSGKRSKQQRREGGGVALKSPPPVRSKGAGPRQASRRMLAIGAAVIVVLVGIGVGIAVALGGSQSSGIPSGTPTIGRVDANSLPGAADAAKLFKGIPQHGLTLGSPFAPAQLVEYIDLQCPVCQAFELNDLPTIVQKYVRPGKLRIEMKPGAIIGPDSVTGQKAAIAASFQNKAFQFAELLYLNQQTENTGWLNDSMVAQAAASVSGLNVKKLFTDRNSHAVQNIQDQVDAKLGGSGAPYNATPTILLGKSGATPKVVSVGLPTMSKLESQIDAATGG